MRRRNGSLRRRHRPCQPTSTNSSTATGCGFRGGRPLASSPPPPLVMYRLYVWWVASRAWSSGGGCTRTWRGPQSCRRCPTSTFSSSVSSPCGRTPPTLMEANGWCDCAKRRRAALGRTCAWRCWASSSWSARSSAASCSPCASRTTTWRCGTARRRTRERRCGFATRCAASCSCRPPCRWSTRRTATACGRRALRTSRRSPSGPSGPSGPNGPSGPSAPSAPPAAACKQRGRTQTRPIPARTIRVHALFNRIALNRRALDVTFRPQRLILR